MGQGFLGWGGTWEADANLVAQLFLGVMVLFGWGLARKKWFRWHAANQTLAVLANLGLVALVMLPSFSRQVLPSLHKAATDRIVFFGLLHAVVGSIALLLAVWVALSAGTTILSEHLRLNRWKLGMRVTLFFWMLALGLGVATYREWYKPETPAAPVAQTPAAEPALTKPAEPPAVTDAAPAQPTMAEVRMTNFEFIPKSLTVKVGTTVVWKNEGGRHTVHADDKAFESENLIKGQSFQRVFEKPGTYSYYCANHGAVGGKAMSGTIVVEP